MADIFVSYTSSDRDWAFWIAKELEALGHRPHIHEWELSAGDDIYAWMEQRYDTADNVLCVISDDYLKAPYSTLERNAALWRAAGKGRGFALLVAVKPCKLPTLSDHIRRCVLFGIPKDAAQSRFREFMQKREVPEIAAFPGKVFAVSNIPIRVPEHFLGREDSLAAIETALGRYEGRVAITALHGLRGVGKTTLAAAYAERHRGDYRATWWIRAQTKSTMRADLVGLGVRLGWVASDEKEEPALVAVVERLRHEGEGILLVFDNATDADSLKPYLPRGGAARVLVTSNAPAWRGVASPVEIRLWPTQIGADYFIARTGREMEREAAEALSDALGGLPLAHEQAAAYCERLEISLADYRRRFEATPARMLDAERDAPAEYHDRLTVAKTFALAIDEAARMNPAAEPLILHAALLAPEPIPLFLFSEAREKFGEPLASALADDGLDEAVASLRAFALVDRESILDERDPSITTNCIRLHRLVRHVAQARRPGATLEEARRALVDVVVAVYPENVWNDPKTWPRARRLDATALALVNGETVPTRGVACLLDRLGAYRHFALAAYAQARPLKERAVAVYEQVVGAEHPETAMSLCNLAHLLIDEGDLAGAQLLQERALAIQEKVLGREHADTAWGLNNLAYILQAQGDLAGSRPLHERALAIRERVLGSEHPDTARSLNNVAHLLQSQGDFAGARPLHERALAIREKVLGRENAETVGSIINLSIVLKEQGDFAAARALLDGALAICQKVLGPEHPIMAHVLSNLALLLEAQSDLAGARPLHERALAIREKVLGPEHPNTATSLNNLGCLLRDLGQTDKAEPLFRRAIAIGEKTLGIEHQLTQRYQTQYARLLLATDRPADALKVGQTALGAHERLNGPDHVWTKDSARGIADALDALDRAAEAAAMRERYGLRDCAGRPLSV